MSEEETPMPTEEQPITDASVNELEGEIAPTTDASNADAPQDATPVVSSDATDSTPEAPKEAIQEAASIALAAAIAPPPKKIRPMIPENSDLGLAKAFLQKHSEKSNGNLYDHLTNVVMRVLETRHSDALGNFCLDDRCV